MKLLEEMPKITKCLKCLKLRYSVDFNKQRGVLSISIMTERSDIHKSSIFNLQSSIPACPG